LLIIFAFAFQKFGHRCQLYVGFVTKLKVDTSYFLSYYLQNVYKTGEIQSRSETKYWRKRK